MALAACKSTNSSGGKPSAQNAEAKATTAAEPTLQVTPVKADPREPLLSKMVAELLSSQHVRKRPIDDSLSQEAFREYLDRLDPAKLFLLQEHVDLLRAHARRMDDQLRAGDLTLAHLAAALLDQRRAVVAKLIAETLQKPFDFTDEETLETDGEKRAFARTEAELAERWRKVLELEVLERVARMEEIASGNGDDDDDEEEDDAAARERPDDIPPTLEGRETKAREDLAKSFAGRFSRLEQQPSIEPLETFLNAVATVYDPHTTYLAPADKENFDIEMTGSLEGIGAILSEDDHYILVRELVPGGASWRQGELEAGDLILAVAQDAKGEPVDVADMPIDQVVQMIRGPKDSIVRLTVKKADGTVEEISITRDVVVIEAAYARGAVLDLGPKHRPVGYVYLPSFYGDTSPAGGVDRNATDDVRAILRELARRKVSGVILDMRANGGGLLEQARDVTGLFIPKGPVVQTRYSDGETQILRDEDPRVAWDGEVVVLVDRFSASASEIVAGALQDYERALIVGTGPTHGKGTVQMLVSLDRVAGAAAVSEEPLGVLKLTIQQFFRVDGDSTQWRGVVPDIVLPDPVAHVEAGERALEHSIPWSEIDALTFEKWPKRKWEVDTLTAKSAKRREKNPTFAKIEARGAYLDAREEDTVVQLQREAWLAKRKADEKALEAVDPELDEQPPRFKVTEVDYNGKKTTTDKRLLERLERWREDLARDPWIEESLYLVADMNAAR